MTTCINIEKQLVNMLVCLPDDVLMTIGDFASNNFAVATYKRLSNSKRLKIVTIHYQCECCGSHKFWNQIQINPNHKNDFIVLFCKNRDHCQMTIDFLQILREYVLINFSMEMIDETFVREYRKLHKFCIRKIKKQVYQVKRKGRNVIEIQKRIQHCKNRLQLDFQRNFQTNETTKEHTVDICKMKFLAIFYKIRRENLFEEMRLEHRKQSLWEQEHSERFAFFQTYIVDSISYQNALDLTMPWQQDVGC